MYKNQLQEFCQKRKIPLPTYKTSKVKMGFISIVTIPYKGLTTQGNTKPTKKKAEISAAEELLIVIKNNQTVTKYTSDQDIYVLIDMENIHMGDYFDLKCFSSKYKFIGFATKNHSSLNVSSPNINVHTIESSRRDACDIMMIGYTSRLVMKLFGPTQIYIVTKDHFGEGLVDYINSLETGVEIYSVKSPKDLTF